MITMVSQKKMYAYASIALGVVGGFLSMSTGALGFIGGMISFFFSILAGTLLSYGYVIIPIITNKTKITIVDSIGEYEFPPSEDVMIKKVGNIYYASAFLGIEIYESPTAQIDEGITYTEFLERAISSTKYVTKIGYITYVEDIGKKRQEIDTKRAEAQLKLQRERDKSDPDPLRIDKLEAELRILDFQLEKLIKGIKPMGVVAYAMTTAAGVSRDSVITSARAQAEQIRTAISNSLNVEVKWLSGDETLRCFEWERFFPPTIRELEDTLG